VLCFRIVENYVIRRSNNMLSVSGERKETDAKH
jgi:hypothetical protein